ncbi:acyl-CoA dehydrogenase family protein [Actinomadura flavalba]|uniref:acyl-CoA dehydrogenase family protein n=1 Tax=Actinomadura flavalba TaxID=1120938 RepID=UPI000380EC43|nr:acyl-CoA dehydrogenase family protein [Actinomadura flavalba]
MKFVLNAEQRMFGATLRELLSGAGVPDVLRGGDWRPLWSALADAGVFAVAVPEKYDGAGVLPVELVTALHELGRHAVPGPVVETVAAAVLLDRDPLADAWLPRVASGDAVVSVARPYALDADRADLVLAADGTDLRAAAPGRELTSLDPARRLFEVVPGEVLARGVDTGPAFDLATLACAAQQLGVGRGLLERTVAYAGTREQFGRPIGAFQAVKHHLASVLTGLEFARPLVYGAALAHGTPDFARDVSAAKAACARASYAAARVALQVHGAIGYTEEFDGSFSIRKARALYNAWGSPSEHRARVLAAL